MVNILKLREIDSTNNFAKQLVKLYTAEELNNTVVCAQAQTNGRGTGNNKWISEPGKNLTFSIIHIPSYLYIDELFYLSKAISLAITTFLESHEIECAIKWPNDILVGTEKIAGILIENSIAGTKIRYSIIGIGLNVNQTQFPPGINATSMKLITGKEYDLNTVLTQLLEKIYFWLEKLQQSKFDIIDNEYLKRLYLYKQQARFKKNGEYIDGIIVGVDQFGRLLLDVPQRNALYSFNQKEIELVQQ